MFSKMKDGVKVPVTLRFPASWYSPDGRIKCLAKDCPRTYLAQEFLYAHWRNSGDGDHTRLLDMMKQEVSSVPDLELHGMLQLQKNSRLGI